MMIHDEQAGQSSLGRGELGRCVCMSPVRCHKQDTQCENSFGNGSDENGLANKDSGRELFWNG